MKFLSLCFLLSVVFLIGCSKYPKGTIAKVGGDYITEADYIEKQSGVPESYLVYLKTSEGKKQFLDILLRERLMFKDAQNLNITKSKEYRTKIADIKKSMDEDFESYKERLTTKLWLKNLEENGILEVGESQIKDYHKKFPYEVSISHIMVTDAEKAEEVLKEVRRYKKDFKQFAKRYSKDPETKNKGGKIEPFIIGELFLPELEDAALGMKTNELQGVFKSKFGYHIIKKHNKRRLSLKDAKDRIKRVLEKKKLDEYIENLKKKYKAEVVNEEYI